MKTVFDFLSATLDNDQLLSKSYSEHFRHALFAAHGYMTRLQEENEMLREENQKLAKSEPQIVPLPVPPAFFTNDNDDDGDDDESGGGKDETDGDEDGDEEEDDDEEDDDPF